MNGPTRMLRWVTLCSAVLGVLATAGSLAVPGEGITLGVALGAGLAVANMYALQRLGARLVSRGGEPSGMAATAALFGAKILVYMAAVYLAYRFFDVDVLAMLVGLSTIVLAIPLGAVLGPPLDAPSETTHG